MGVGTVSRVINGSAAVSEATRRRVLEVVADLGYEPNATARALSTGRTRSVGVIAPYFTRPSVIERLRGVAPLLASSGYQLVLFDVERPDQRTGVFRSVIGRVDGLLTISLAPPKADLRRLAAAGIPVVLVDHAHESVATVTVDEVHGSSASTRRCAGYRRALADAGIAVREELVVLRPHGQGAGEIVEELLALDEPPTAIFAASDQQALAVLDAVTDLGLRVPEDLSVVGFDDVELARYAGLTTVAQPLAVSGTKGAELLLASLDGSEISTPRQHLPLELVVRDTTAPPGSRTGPIESTARSVVVERSG